MMAAAEPISVSVKGAALLTLKDLKSDMTSTKIWKMIKNFMSLYKDKVTVAYSIKRGSTERSEVDDDNVRKILADAVGGCIAAWDIKACVGRSMNLFVGDCYNYAVPIGSKAQDTGHKSIIVTLPFSMDGCYTISTSFSGKISTSAGREHYALECDMEVYIGKMDEQTYHTMLDRGMKVYPFKLNHPEYFEGDMSSGSEMVTDTSDQEDQAPTYQDRQKTKQPRKVLNRGIIKSSIRKKPTRSSVSKMTSAIQAVRRTITPTSEPHEEQINPSAPAKDTIYP